MFKRLLSLVLALGLLCYGPAARAVESTGTPVSANFTALSVSASILPNPDRGWAGYSGGDFVNGYSAASVTSAYNNGYRLVFAYVDIGAFRGTTISTAWLNQFQANLNDVRSKGMKIVATIYYDYTGAGNDDTAANMAVHMAQLKPYLYANADVIPFWKAGLIGAYGEWHSSQHQNTCGFNSGTTPCSTANANRLLARNFILDNVHPYTSVLFRFPDDLMQWYPTVSTQNQAFNGTRQSRAAFVNDCQLSAGNDTGTFSVYNGGFSTSSQMTYTGQSTAYTAYGGELSNSCSTPHRTTCADVRADWATFHVQWMKDAGTDQAEWTNAWTAGGCYNEVVNRMGYRLQYDSISHQGTAVAGQTITASVNLRNVGFGRFLDPRKLKLVFVLGGTTIPCTSRVDMRSLPAQGTSSFNISVPCTVPPGTPAGTYAGYLQVLDRSNPGTAKFAVQPANATAGWDATNFRYATTTTLVVS